MKRLFLFSFILVVSMLVVTSCGGKKKQSKSTKKTSKVKKTSSKYVDTKIQKVVKEARSYKGTKYKYGGTTRKGMDCSALMCASYQSIGVTIPRTSNAQSKIGKRVYIGELQPGDLVFFGAKPGSKKITHVGLITEVTGGSIKFMHASTKAGVVESELNSTWYKPRYIKAVRPKS